MMEVDEVLRDISLESGEMKQYTKVFVVSREKFVEAVERIVESFGKDKVFVSTYVAIDRPDQKVIELNLFLTILGEKYVVCLRTSVPRDDPRIKSIVNILPSALVGELEIHDLFGVVFEGNPHIKRPVFAPEDVVKQGIYPLRKDFRLRG